MTDEDEPDSIEDERPASEPEAADEPTDEPAAPARRRRTGRTLLMLGGAVWSIAAAVRCAGPPAGQPLSVATIDPSSAPEPASARDDAPEPEATSKPMPGPADVEPPDEDEPPEEEPRIADWLDDVQPPRIVHYEIRRGGSMMNVANLYKIYHHEITALNPGVALESELAPGTKLVVYRKKDGVASESIGLPSAGSVQGAVPMPAGPGRQLKAIPWKTWGTEHSVATLDRILRRWAERGKHVQPILVGNMSARQGGRLDPHSTHQSGRDVDLGYVQRIPKGEELAWREMNADNLDAAETWALLELLRDSGKVEVVLVDRGIQALLYEHAVANGRSKSSLRRWLEYPRFGRAPNAFIQHVPGHTDHLHVRFRCTPEEPRCRSR